MAKGQIVKTRFQAVQLAKSKGYVVNYSGFIRNGEKCNCIKWYKPWTWFWVVNRDSYSGAEDSMPGEALKVVTILICEHCGKDMSSVGPEYINEQAEEDGTED